jgi:hypothetical protein
MWGHRVGIIAASILGLLQAGGAAPISDCGGPSDLLKNVQITVSPETISKSEPFTITATGTLDADITEGIIHVDVEAKLLLLGISIVDQKAKSVTTFSMSPGLPAGDVSIAVGPMKLPTVPGSFELSGKVAITDTGGAPITCIALDWQSPLLAEGPSVALLPKAVAAPAASGVAPVVSDCTKPADHLHDFESTLDGDTRTITWTIDEDITSMAFSADFVAHVFFALKVELFAPVKYSPGFKRGPLKITVVGKPERDSEESGRAVAEDTGLRAGPEITGNVLWLDAANEEVACIQIDTVIEETLVV